MHKNTIAQESRNSLLPRSTAMKLSSVKKYDCTQSNMHLAKQPHDNDLSESRSADTDDIVVIIGNEQLSQATGNQQQPTTSGARETEEMRQHPSAQRLRNDDDNDDEESNDNVIIRFEIRFRKIEYCVSRCITVFGGETNAAADNLDRLGQIPHETVAVPDRMPSRLGLHLLPPTRHLNRPILPLRDDIERHLIDSTRRHSIRWHVHFHTFTCIYILRPI